MGNKTADPKPKVKAEVQSVIHPDGPDKPGKIGGGVGRIEEKAENKGKELKFFSKGRETMLFITADSYIKFNNRQFTTKDKEIIEFIRGHPAFNVDVWEGKLPDWYTQRLKEDKDKLSMVDLENE